METAELLRIIANGEDSTHQFKSNVTNEGSLAAEMVAFSNSKGGVLIIGITDDGLIAGLTDSDIKLINNRISNAASDLVKPAINPITQNFSLPDGKILVVTIESGLNKPYMDNSGYIWVKSGADKRRVTAREELQRIFQNASLIHADETPVANSSLTDIDWEFFEDFFVKEYSQSIEEFQNERINILENMNIARNAQLNIAGVLLFSTKPQIRLPAFNLKAVAIAGTDIEDINYIDSQDMNGKLSDIFQKTLSFILSNIRHVQHSQGFNSLGEPEIPRIVFEELIANALIHRDYFISAPIRVLIFSNRIEIISPGYLPNNLTIENIKMGNSNMRNPILASFATKLLPYRGLGSGIKRAIKVYPEIEFIDDRSGNLFKVIISRPAKINQ